MKGEALKGHLDVLLLAAVASGPAHGYAIIETISQHSGGAFALPEGTVYPALHRLESAGLLKSRWARHQGRRRRIYSLTRNGRTALARRRDDWGAFADAMAGVLGATA